MSEHNHDTWKKDPVAHPVHHQDLRDEKHLIIVTCNFSLYVPVAHPGEEEMQHQQDLVAVAHPKHLSRLQPDTTSTDLDRGVGVTAG